MTILKSIAFVMTMLFLSSFTNNGILVNFKQEDKPIIASYSNLDFIRDAYNYRMKHAYDIPEHYYSMLGIENPNVIVEQPIIPQPVIPKIIIKKEPNIVDSVPLWVRKGILATETRSYYKDDNTIKYVDKRRGLDCDIGPFQMRRIAFDEVKKPKESFWQLEKDTKFAEELACRYLLFIYNNKGNKDWEKTVIMYNTGPYRGWTVKGNRYLNSVLKKGKNL